MSINESNLDKEQKQELVVLEEGALQNKPPKKDIVQSAKDFFGGAFGLTKNKDLNSLIEEFTSEMTLVVEGLSEDQANLFKAQDTLSAQQTIDHEEQMSEIKDMKNRVKDLEKSMTDIKKLVAEKKIKKVEGFTGLVRQATWLVSILAGSWIVVTIFNFFKK